MTQPVLALHGLTVAHRPGHPVLELLDLEIAAGEIVCLIGPSGSGKTTLLDTIAGFIKPESGMVQLSGAQRLGYIFQADALLPWRTVRANLSLGPELAGQQVSESLLIEHLQSFNLDPAILDHFPASLSGGMRQRVAILQALLSAPDLLLLDEPFAALDFPTRLKLEGEFWHQIKSRGKAALLVTHDIEEAIVLADRVVLLRDKRLESIPICFDGLDRRAPAALRARPEFAQYFQSLWTGLESAMS